MSWDSFFCGLDHLRQNCLDFFGLAPHSPCRLHTIDQDGILVADDSSMVSLLEIHGSLRLTGEQEFEAACQALIASLQRPLSRAAHAIQFVFSYDPQAAAVDIGRQMQPLQQSAQALDLDLGGILQDWQENIAQYCASEKIYLALWTRPGIMTASELKRARRANAKVAQPLVRSQVAQSQALIIERMRDVHLAVVKDVQTSLQSLFFCISRLDAHAAIHAIRAMHVPSLTAAAWRPCLPGDPLPLRAPEAGSRKKDCSSFLPPSIARQIWPCSATVHEGRYLEVADRLYAPFIMSLPPQTMLPFNVLFKSLLSEGLPWRCSVLLSGDGMRGQGLKSIAASILSFTSSSNKMLMHSYKQLQELELRNETSVGFQMCFCTWIEKGQGEAQPWRELGQRAARLATAVQSWGSCDTTFITGDALLLYTATLPAMTFTSPAVRAIAPLSDAIHLLPFSRPCSPWQATDLPLRTSDGRYMPIGLMHSNMASWNEICFAGMGAGKSFFLNTLNFFFVVRPGQVRLPWLTVIDIGPSCSGVITLLQAALPPSKKHLAVFAKLRNSRETAINPFDTPLGCPKPLPNHADFLVNLLALLCTPLNETAPADGVNDLLREALDAVYRRLAPDGEAPHLFDSYADPKITDWIKTNHLVIDQDTTWWEIVRELFQAGQIALAVRAQRYAMPLISDLSAEINNPLIRERFNAIRMHGSSETVPEACVRHLTTAIKEYPILANPTRFALGAARIVGLDLMEVTPRGGPLAERQSGIMYLLARYVGAAHFFNTVADLDHVPALYRAWHKPRFEQLSADPKRLCYDEFHRASCVDLNNPLSRQIIADLTTASRESRKQNLSIGLYSQQLGDYPSVLVDLATSIYALGAGNAQEASMIAERFGFNQAAYMALRHIARPTKAGANFVALYRTASGESIQYLTNTVGSYARWAFSTTAEDMQVRNRLYELLGCNRALKLLCRAYPDGSIKAEIERRKLVRVTNFGEKADDLLDELVEELLQRAEQEKI